MNADRLINMLARMFMRHGLRTVSKHMQSGMTPEERVRDKKMRQQSKRMKHTMRVSRKIGRF